MEEMGVFEAMYNCRAMRRLDTRPVPEELLLKLVDAANQAPSGSNLQNGRWIIVRDPSVKHELAALNRAGVEGYLAPQIDNIEPLPHQTVDRRRKMMDAVLWQVEHMHEIPALIIACMELSTKRDPMVLGRAGGSIWPGIQNLLLAARAVGLGAAPTTLALIDQEAAAKVLSLIHISEPTRPY